MSRVLICTACRTPVQVFEAAMGARTEAEHRYLDPATYVCGCCQDPPTLSED